MSKKKTGVFTKKGSPMRKKTAPPTQIHKKKKGKGSYNRKEESIQNETFNEEKCLKDFVESILEKNYADAYKYLNSVVEHKFKAKIAKEISTPLF